MSGTGQSKFAEILKSEREKRKMTLEEMANLLGTTKQVLSRYERGERNPKLTTATIFAQKLGIPISTFEGNMDTSNINSTEVNLSHGDQETARLLTLLQKYSDVIELLESLPENFREQALSYLRFLSGQSDKK